MKKNHDIMPALSSHRIEISSWLMWMPRVIGMTFGILWMFFGFFEALLSPAEWYIGLFEGVLIGGIMMITTYVMTKWEIVGIMICVMESALVFILMIFSRISSPAVYLLLALPLVVMAVLASMHMRYTEMILKDIGNRRRSKN